MKSGATASIFVLLVVSYAGCLGGGSPPVPSPTEAGSPHHWELVSVMASDSYSSSPVIHSRIATLAYYSATDGYAKTVTWGVPGAGTTVVRAPPHLGLALHPVSPGSGPSDFSELNSTLENLRPLVSSTATNTTVNYWLTATSTATTWVVTTTYYDNGTAVRHFIDAVTNARFEISLTNDGSSDAGPTAVNSPDLDYGRARALADRSAKAWSANATAVGAIALESAFPAHPVAFGEVPFHVSYLENVHETVFLPPDMVPGDGRAPVWGFLYHSDTTNEVLPVYVYSTSIVITGDPFAPRWNAAIYQGLALSSSALNSPVAAAYLPAHYAHFQFSHFFLAGSQWNFVSGPYTVRVGPDGSRSVSVLDSDENRPGPE